MTTGDIADTVTNPFIQDRMEHCPWDKLVFVMSLFAFAFHDSLS